MRRALWVLALLAVKFAILFAGGLLDIRRATPDSLVIQWDVDLEESTPGTRRVAHFIDGAYRVTIVDDHWTVVYRLWRDAEGWHCEGDVTPLVTEPTVCRLERIQEPESNGLH